MYANRETPLTVAMVGLVAGATGALAVTVLTAGVRKIMSGPGPTRAAQTDAGLTAGQALAEGPTMPPNMNRVTAGFVQKIATGIFGASLSADQQYLAGLAWHLTYGGFWGVVYALLRSSVGIPAVVLGPLHGLIVWTVGPGWLVPRMKLMLPPGQQRPWTVAVVVGIHAAYGAIVALVVRQLRDEKLSRFSRRS